MGFFSIKIQFGSKAKQIVARLFCLDDPIISDSLAVETHDIVAVKLSVHFIFCVSAASLQCSDNIFSPFFYIWTGACQWNKTSRLKTWSAGKLLLALFSVYTLEWVPTCFHGIVVLPHAHQTSSSAPSSTLCFQCGLLKGRDSVHPF